MRKAQLDIAKEFDLLMVIICSRCSVAERVPANRLTWKLSPSSASLLMRIV